MYIDFVPPPAVDVDTDACTDAVVEVLRFCGFHESVALLEGSRECNGRRSRHRWN